MSTLPFTRTSSYSFSENRNNPKITLNVGGKRYDTTKHTLTKFANEEHYFIKLLSNQWIQSEKDEEIFIDRNGKRFSYVLDFLRDGDVSCKNLKYKLEEILIEAKFFALKSMQILLQNRLEKIKHKELVSNHIKDLTITEHAKVSSLSCCSSLSANNLDSMDIPEDDNFSYILSNRINKKSSEKSCLRNNEGCSSSHNNNNEFFSLSDSQMSKSAFCSSYRGNLSNYDKATEQDVVFQCDRLRFINDDPSPPVSPSNSFQSSQTYTNKFDLGKHVFALDSDF